LKPMRYSRVNVIGLIPLGICYKKIRLLEKWR